MANYVDLDAIYRGVTGVPVPAYWYATVNDNIKFAEQYGPAIGTAVITTDANATAVITFQVPFSSPPTVIATNGDTAAASNVAVYGVQSVTRSAFTVRMSQPNGGPFRVNYIAK